MAAMYILGSYLHMDSYEEVIIILKRILAWLLVFIYHKIYRKYAVIENITKVLYMRFLKTLKGLLPSALPFYLELVSYLIDDCFRINPYGPCVVNILVNG